MGFSGIFLIYKPWILFKVHRDFESQKLQVQNQKKQKTKIKMKGGLTAEEWFYSHEHVIFTLLVYKHILIKHMGVQAITNC